MRFFLLSLNLGVAVSFVPSLSSSTRLSPFISSTLLFAEGPDEQDTTADADGADLAAELFKLAKERNIQIDADDDDWDDEEDLDDDEAKELNLTDNQIDKEVKERVLETAGGFVEYVKPPSDDEDGDDESKEEEEEKQAKEYKPPTKIPDEELTAGEVVELILNALAHNDVPSKNKGIEILFAYSSSSSQIKQMEDLTPEEYCEYLKENDFKVVFENQGFRIDKGDYSSGGTKAFYTARVQVSPKETIAVNFILSSGGLNDNNGCWLVDSMLIRPPSMRRNRRR
mmetsp:Transcript_30738/g.46606  ORF Transcript_30738/g.46606 Transcript_30738/m.46606 type:complete len:284 (-) Transcript_30738:87-938(-)